MVKCLSSNRHFCCAADVVVATKVKMTSAEMTVGTAVPVTAVYTDVVAQTADEVAQVDGLEMEAGGGWTAGDMVGAVDEVGPSDAASGAHDAIIAAERNAQCLWSGWSEPRCTNA